MHRSLMWRAPMQADANPDYDVAMCLCINRRSRNFQHITVGLESDEGTNSGA